MSKSKTGNPVIGRRKLLTTAAAGVMTATVAAPAIAQSQPKIRWRMPSSFGKNITPYVGAEMFCKLVHEMTDGNFEISYYAPGEIVPALQVADAVANGTVEIGHTASFYYAGKNPSYALASGIVFGMNVRGHAAWLVKGGGNEIMNEFYKSNNIYALFSGNTGAQSAGWFRKEIKSIADFRGLRMRIAGLAGQVFLEAGGVPQQIAVGDVYAALERGSIDGTKFTSPIDDERLGFHKVAPYYYWPGWNDGGVAVHKFINLAKWNELPKSYQAILQAAASYGGEQMQTTYDAGNRLAVKRIVAQGAQIRFLPNDVIDTLADAAKRVYGRISKENPAFGKIYENYVSFMQDEYTWWRVSELPFDTMMVRQLNRS